MVTMSGVLYSSIVQHPVSVIISWSGVRGWIKVSCEPCRGSTWLGPLSKIAQSQTCAYGYLAPSVITSLTCVVRSYAQADILSPTLVGPKMNNNNYNNKTTNKKSGSSLSKPEGTSSSVSKATARPSLQRAPASSSKRGAFTATSATASSEAAGTSSAVSQLSAAIQSGGDGSVKEARARFWPNVVISDPAKAGYTERRSACRLLKKVHSDPPTEEEMTIELKKSIEWANAVIPDFSLEHLKVAASTASKRQRSTEATKPTAKKAKTHVVANKSFAEVARDRIIIAVLDQNDPEGKIPKDQWKWVQFALTTVALDVLCSNPGPPPSCTDAGWYQGQIKMIACDDERSVVLYKAAVSMIGEVYPGAKLIAVDKKDIPSRPRARVWIPAALTEPGKIMQLIKTCNPSLPIDNWRFLKIEDSSSEKTNVPEPEKRATMQVLLSISNDSLDLLAKCNGVVNYGFGKVTIKVYKSDADAIEQLASATEPTPSDDEDEKMSDVESIGGEQGYTSSQSTIASALGAMYTETQLLSDSQEDVDVTLTDVASSADQPPPQ